MMILMMIIIILIIIAIMIMMIEIMLIIAVVIINSPFQPGDFSTGSTTVYCNNIESRNNPDVNIISVLTTSNLYQPPMSASYSGMYFLR